MGLVTLDVVVRCCEAFLSKAFPATTSQKDNKWEQPRDTMRYLETVVCQKGNKPIKRPPPRQDLLTLPLAPNKSTQCNEAVPLEGTCRELLYTCLNHFEPLKCIEMPWYTLDHTGMFIEQLKVDARTINNIQELATYVFF